MNPNAMRIISNKDDYSSIYSARSEVLRSKSDYFLDDLKNILFDSITDPVQRQLAMYEFDPSRRSIGSYEKIVYDVVGTDFMTNQPIFKERLLYEK